MFRIPSDPSDPSDNGSNPVVPSTTESGDDDATGTNNYGDVNEFNELILPSRFISSRI